MITKRIRAAMRALSLAVNMWMIQVTSRRCVLCNDVIPNDTAIPVCGRCIAGHR